MTKIITAAIVIGCTILMIGWDIYVAANGIPGDTISEILLAFVWSHPFLAFAWGVLTGHLFFPIRKALDFEIPLVIALSVLGGILLVFDLTKVLPQVIPIVYVLPGMIAGHFLWAQPYPKSRRD